MKYFTDNNLIYIDINKKIKYSEAIIRDTVHTTDLGSNLYSEYIYEEFIYNYTKLKIPQNIIKTNLISIKKIDINKKFKKYMKIKGDCVIYTCTLIIGPLSGYIGIDNMEILLWDKWCSYERKHCNIENIKINGYCEFKILQKNVDYSYSKHNFNFNNIVYQLNINEIYYIGNNLQFIEGL